MQLTSESVAALHRSRARQSHRETFSGICRIDYEFLRFITHSSRLRKYILNQHIFAEHTARSIGWFGNTCLFESLFVREPKLHARRSRRSHGRHARYIHTPPAIRLVC
jgi:hypothetical protein